MFYAEKIHRKEKGKHMREYKKRKYSEISRQQERITIYTLSTKLENTMR
jgi:hypothetical protein